MSAQTAHRLSAVDAGFLMTEARHSPKHVASLQILRLPRGKGPAWLRRMLADLKAVPPGFPFNQRLRDRSLLAPALVADDRFDIDYHVRHSVLPGPGSEQQLVEMVSRLHANLLDRDRPLWEFHLIEGLEGRRFAFYTKIHHAIADGVTFTRWFVESGSTSPSGRTHPVWARDERPAASPEDRGLFGRLDSSWKAVSEGVETTADLTRLGARLLWKNLMQRNPDAVLPLAASRTRLNVPTGAARSFGITRYPLKVFRSLAHEHGCTINDLVMTLCDLAVNRYLEEAGAAPDEPLVAYMPVNLRSAGADEGNIITLLQVRLASEHDDPVAALDQVRQASRETREIFTGVSRTAVQLYSLGVALLPLGEELLHLDRVLPPAINLVISNVPGPAKRMYFRGAEVLEAYPVNTLPPAVALNMTVCSYAGTMFFGLVGGRSVIPDIYRLVELLDQACQQFQAQTRNNRH